MRKKTLLDGLNNVLSKEKNMKEDFLNCLTKWSTQVLWREKMFYFIRKTKQF